MQAAFTVGLIVGALVGIPLFAAKRPMAGIGIQIGSATAAAVFFAQFEAVDHAFVRWTRILGEHPMVLVGFAFGLTLVGIVYAAILRVEDRDRT